jgi:predicted ATPase/Tfp pilus assembly protein PilF
VYRVPSLSMPDLNQPSTPGNLMLYESVLLFVERAVAAKPDFILTEHNALALATVCRRLDGIPLAIELAAARTRFMTIEELAERLDDRFRILTGGSRTALPRQQTLRALIDWSYDLLDEKQKVLLNRLSVFVGGWTLEAAEKVCSGGRVKTWEILDLLTALYDKSLVLAEEHVHSTRYRALETVRQYARDRLAETGESVAIRGQHLDYYLNLAEEGDKHIRGSEQRQWLHRFEVEHDNIRSALDWSMQDTDHTIAALRMTVALWWFWHIGGYLTEGRERLALALARPSAQQRTVLRASALNGAGNLARIQGDYTDSHRLLEENLSIHGELHNTIGRANANNSLGLLAEAEGDTERARELYEQAVILHREAGSQTSGATALSNLGALVMQLGESDLARLYLEESLSISREKGDFATMSGTLNNLGLVARSQGDYATARKFLTEAILVMQRLGYKVFIANTLGSLASLARAQNQWSRAVRLFTAMNSVRDALGARLPLPERQWVEGVLDELETTLGAEGFALAASEGKTMDIEQAIEYATTVNS